MKRREMFVAIFLLALLISVTVLFARSTSAATLLGTPLLMSRVFDFAQLAAPGGCGFGQMAFLAPLAGMILIARARRDRDN